MVNLSLENRLPLPESDAAEMNFSETELTLRLPGESRLLSENNSGTKRTLSDMVDLNLENSVDRGDKDCSELENGASSLSKAPASKTQVVGWPPVGGHRRNVIKICKYVKVAVDGAPYLRKVDLEKYNSYQQLLSALEDLFSCLTIRNHLNEKKIVDQVDGFEYVPVYEDKDGDWMMGGDVPWNIFVESCERLRLMKRSDAIGLDTATRTPSKCSSTR